ncbi:major facilitator superfamily domain-containing protein [Gigaspora rosea]|uniref:Major facilitator superfamily domain-containing protein n=1 Tax=Gigaspora rosea TaxID=44941 RepID=A0A397UDG2_9GLOM|nr:major facilitator superfamily domain-containing protein [Gigaspora rosea]
MSQSGESTTIFDAEREQFLNSKSSSRIALTVDDTEIDDENDDIFFENELRTGLDSVIEDIGFGKFQKQLLVLCGFGWLADNMWLQCVTMILPRVQVHYQVSNSVIGFLPSAVTFGMMFGALFWGTFSDSYGRKQAFNWTLAVTAFFGIFSSFAQSFTQLCFLLFFMGFGVGGNLPVDGAIFLEFVPKNQQHLLTFMSIFWPFGAVVTSLFSYLVLPQNSCPESDGITFSCDISKNNGWRYLLAILGSLTLLMLIGRVLLFGLKESPKFLMARNKHNEAAIVLREIAHINGREISVDANDLSTSDETPPRVSISMTYPPVKILSNSHYRYGGFFADPMYFIKNRISSKRRDVAPLFTPKWIKTTILVWTIWSVISMAFVMFNVFLPKYLEALAGTENSGSSGSDILDQVMKDILLFSFWGIPGSLIGTWLIDTPLGRRYTMAAGAFSTSLSVFLFTVLKTRIGTVICCSAISLFTTIKYAVIYGYTAEVFETKIRGTANGIASACARITGILAPIITGNLFSISLVAPIYVSAILFAIGGVCMVLLPIETKGRRAIFK